MKEEIMKERDRQVLSFIARFLSRVGMPPTQMEIAFACGFRSLSAVRASLRRLESAGAIRLTGGARGIDLLDITQIHIKKEYTQYNPWQYVLSLS